MFDLEEIKAWHALLTAVVGAALVMVGRVSATRKNVRKDGAEGDLYANLSSALSASEGRRKEEAEAYRAREEHHERRHKENTDRMLEMAIQLARVEGKLDAMEKQSVTNIEALQRSSEVNRRLAEELSDYRKVIIAHFTGNPQLPFPAPIAG